MLFKTHIVFGFIVALLSLKYLQPENQILFACIVMSAAALPDIDHPQSVVGRKFRPLSYLFEHRGFFHSFFAIAGFTFLVYGFSGSVLYSSAFLLGYASHILADAVSDGGIMPFHPLLHLRLKGFFKTGSVYEYILLVALVCVAVIIMFKI
ncbi:TPA: metal-dependent hydrolase [Candidatus Woesearchaeota archaeon]|nr:metal-dependent hydrolase [Candidatus Woesearchaeota archaeon]